MGNVYIGVSNKARKVSNIYVGVSNKARKVQKAYVGVSNKAMLVYTSGSGVDPTKSEFTEAEVNALAAYGEINKVAVGSTFTIANSLDTNRSIHTYVVIGKDHKDLNVDNYPSEPANTGTVDVWGTGAIASKKFKSIDPPGQWHNSDIRTWLNGDFYNGFNSTTKVYLKQMTTEYFYSKNSSNNYMTAKGNNDTRDYVKLLSTREFNPSNYYTNSGMHEREGNGYEYFPYVGYTGGTADTKKRYASATGSAGVQFQWRRSCVWAGFYGGSVWQVSSNGNLNGMSGGTGTFGVVPCFRFGS